MEIFDLSQKNMSAVACGTLNQLIDEGVLTFEQCGPIYSDWVFGNRPKRVIKLEEESWKELDKILEASDES